MLPESSNNGDKKGNNWNLKFIIKQKTTNSTFICKQTENNIEIKTVNQENSIIVKESS